MDALWRVVGTMYPPPLSRGLIPPTLYTKLIPFRGSAFMRLAPTATEEKASGHASSNQAGA